MFKDQIFDVPLGIRALEKIASKCCVNFPFKWKLTLHKFNVLFLTFLSYSSYHLARKPTSVVKNVLYKNCTGEKPPEGLNITDKDNCSWAPFDGEDHSTLLGAIDSSFLFAYAIGMYFTGSLGERMNIRIFLSVGMLLSGVFGLLFGVAYWTNIHSLAYFIIIQLLAGFCQSTGWPGCVAAVGNWFGKSKRGFIMGIWRSHHSVGNILGSLIAGIFVSYDWGLSFAVPAAIIMSLGILLFFFMVPDPRAVGCPMPEHHDPSESTSSEEPLSTGGSEMNMEELGATGSKIQLEDSKDSKNENEKAIGFLDAVKIPGVIEFSFCLFFTKLINYTFLYWLPAYIKHSTDFDSQQSADLSTLFDIGGIFGGIIAGLITDLTGMSAITCAVNLILLFPMLFVYQAFGAINLTLNIVLLFIVGLLANGPYALITTAVSADLGTHESLKNSAKALATVTAIIDGTGSIGAAVGPLMAGPVSATNWENVFYVLMGAAGLALLFLMRLIVKEIKQVCKNRKSAKKTTSSSLEPNDAVVEAAVVH